MKLSPFFATLLLASLAHADVSFPGEIKSHYNITCQTLSFDPQGEGCIMCHQQDPGECGSIVNPLGLWLEKQGINCGNASPAALDPLLDQLKNDNVDTNCDGTPDYQQLTSCNWAALRTNDCGLDGGSEAGEAGTPVGPDMTENVIYGCATTQAPAVPGAAAVGIASALLGLVGVRRLRRRNGVRGTD
jgi:hypothetical protein